MPKSDIARYARHSRWSDPGRFAACLDPVSADPSALPEIVGGLVLHPLFAPAGADRSEASLRSIPEILAALLAHDNRPLDRVREQSKRVIGTCRNYALLACAILRQHGTPARLRVGFADYFTPDFWEDHWVCEYHDGRDWRLLDAELTTAVRRRLAIGFDPADVPRDRLLAAGPAWLGLRRGEHKAARFGVSILGIAGPGFVAGTLARDLAALAMEEMMPWDYWGPPRNFRPGGPIPAEWLDRLDGLAAELAREPATYDDAKAILAAHPWAALTPTVLSFPEGKPVEVTLGH
ncbi:MAG TPA: transglutaminase domain-containing protein [Stellaceae bacterium]|nr:transglutaminase domain-containing protein [Stellaceae bacterium]